MSRIIDKMAIVGDMHLSSRTPSSRLDDYANTSIDKLDKLLNLCIKEDIKYVVSLGDTFNTPTDTLLYVNRVMQKLKEFERNGIFFYSILGNHSCANMKHENVDKSSEGILYISHLIRELQYEPFTSPSGYTIGLYGYHYSQPINLPTKGDKINICVAHKGYNEAYDGSLTKTSCLELGYNIYCLGHFHQPYNPLYEANYSVIRPGRFMRNTADEFNFTNEINIDVLHFLGTKERPKITTQRLTLNVDDYTKTFSTKVLTKCKENDKYLSSLSSRVQDLMLKMDMSYEAKDDDIFNILDRLDVDYRIKDNLILYLSSIGINKTNI